MSVSTTMDLTAMNNALKELYDGQTVNNLVYKNQPWMALVPKDKNFGGKYKPVPIFNGVSQGRSAVFATAQANATAPVVNSFLLTRKKDYSIGYIDNETMEASATDKMAFIQGAKFNVDSAFRSASLSLGSALLRNGKGSIGKIASGGITSGVITLDDAGSVVQFEVNQTLQAAATDGATPRAAKGYVIAVNRSAGTVTVSDTALGGSAGSPSGWAAADFLLQDGDSNAKVSGVAAWIPATAPAATSFYGVDRSSDPVRLGGVRYDGSAQSIEEALIDSSSLLAREGGSPDVALMGYASYSALEKSLGSKVQYVDMKGPGEIAFRGIRINGAAGEIKVMPDRNVPGLVSYLLQMDTWEFGSLGDAPKILTYGDGLQMLRVYNADSGEVRVGYYGNLSCNAPGWNAYVGLGA